MYEVKTRQTEASVRSYLDGIADEQRRRDCEALVELMSAVTGELPRMWGGSIVGFGSYHYKYASGHEGDACLVGFSSRKGDMSLYVTPCFAEFDRLVAGLGKHKAGKACLYMKRLSDINLQVLRDLVQKSVADIRIRYPATNREACRETPP